MTLGSARFLALLLGGAAAACSGRDRQLTPAEWLAENTALLEKLRSYDANERTDAINQFKKVGRQRGTQYALTLLLDPKLEDYRIEVVLARILADWRDRRAIPFLLEHLYHADEGAVEIAKEGLEVFRDEPRLIDALAEKVKGPVVRERRIAADLLSDIGGERAVEIFAERYRAEEDREVRFFFLNTIIGSSHRERSSMLVDALNDPDPALREYAWGVLRRDEKLPSAVRFDPRSPPEDRAQAVALLRLWVRETGDGRERRPRRR